MKLLQFPVLLLFSAPLLAMEPAPKPKILTPKIIATLNQPQNSNKEIYSACYSPDGAYVILGGAGTGTGNNLGCSMVWSTSNLTQPISSQTCRDGANSITTNPNNKEFATTDWNNIDVWDITTNANTITIPATDGYLGSIDYDTTGSLIASADSQGLCKIWDIRSKTCIKTLQSGNEPLWYAQWNPDNTQIATTSGDDNVRIFDTRTNQILHTINIQGGLGTLAYNETGKQLALAAHRIILCDPSTGKIVAQYSLRGKKLPVNAPAPAHENASIAQPIHFVPGHNDVVIAGIAEIDCGKVTLIDLHDDNNSLSFWASLDMIDLAVAPNAKQFVSCSAKGPTNVWDLEEYLKERKAKLQPTGWSCRLQ